MEHFPSLSDFGCRGWLFKAPRPPGVITTTLHEIADMLRISATRRDRRRTSDGDDGDGAGLVYWNIWLIMDNMVDFPLIYGIILVNPG